MDDMSAELEHFTVGERVRKITGDYHFDGVIVSIFSKSNGVTRIVVEEDRGMLHIFNPAQLGRACKSTDRGI